MNSGGRFQRILALVILTAISLPVFVSALKPDKDKTVNANQIKPVIPTANRYEAGKVFLEHADSWSYDEQKDIAPEDQYQVLVGNVVFRKNDMFMYCDSAYFYENSNSFDAFSNVRMEQGDTLFVFADELNYDGSTELATAYANAGKKVRLINRDVTLTTDVFNYDLEQNFGYYNVGGVLTDKKNRLVSMEGEYYPDTKDAYFNYDVKLTSLNGKDTLLITTDSLIYNTGTHIADIVAPTKIVNSDGTIFSHSGNYNTETGVGDLFDRSLVVTNRGNTLTGDRLYYDRKKGYGEAFGSMIITDSARQVSLFGDYGFYNEIADSAFVTGRALAKEYSRGDTLYLHADTIYSYMEHEDSTNVMNAFRKVRFYRSDIQGVCDSLSSTERDSILRMYYHPIVWSDERQVFGNVINVHVNDSTVDWARLPQFGFVAEHIAEDCFQQISSSDLTIWFNDSTINQVYGDGNVMLIMFPMENDSTYNKYAYVESSIMDAYFKDNDIESVHFRPETTSKVVPLYLAKKNSYFLPKFAWYETIRPTYPMDVYNIPQEMIDLFNTEAPAPDLIDKTQVNRMRRVLNDGSQAPETNKQSTQENEKESETELEKPSDELNSLADDSDEDNSPVVDDVEEQILEETENE
ncbi:MAG: LPS export ABC transporter periplasmic protein LptC [Paramuribaculum sp.]|nr:LPS export ABC transporter periplasmic protein LptC [Paramuribaculum sp.]